MASSYSLIDDDPCWLTKRPFYRLVRCVCGIPTELVGKSQKYSGALL